MFGLIDSVRKAMPIIVFATCYLSVVTFLFLT
ncbi:hypothetical protein P775_00525 [Puniceibacterium antarcticum]|uniref:Uncharacterized protein n=1 Tax=Puniceibacterium antarcticum TaxID=1206336 RepID=A0A2G8RL77_9RHOB|nr:hypothetical protein P775_00525 [Puniceibacterium antarcticum]